MVNAPQVKQRPQSSRFLFFALQFFDEGILTLQSDLEVCHGYYLVVFVLNFHAFV
jgi:hypothetical protein